MGEVRELSRKVDRLEEVLIELAVAQRRNEEAQERFWQGLEELKEAQRKTEEAQRQTEESLRELSEAQRRTERSEEQKRFWRGLEELKEAQRQTEQSLKELSEAQRRTEQSLRELSESQKKTEEALRDLKETQQKTEESLNKLNRKLIELSDRLGTLAEDILAPGIPYLLERLGYRVKNMWTNEEVRRPDGVNCEFDVVAVAEKDGREVLFLCEVKSKLREKHFEQLKKQCELYREYGVRRDLFIIPVLAALNIPEHLVNYANKRGVLLVKMGGDYLEALNPEVLGA